MRMHQKQLPNAYDALTLRELADEVNSFSTYMNEMIQLQRSLNPFF